MEQKSLTLRIPAETRKKLKLLAAHYDVSMTDVIVHLVELQSIELKEPNLKDYKHMQARARVNRLKTKKEGARAGKEH